MSHRSSLTCDRVAQRSCLKNDSMIGFTASGSAHMLEWDSQIDLIKDRAESTQPETQSEYFNAIEALQLKREEVALKLHGIACARDDEWQELKTGTEHALGEVRTIFYDAITKIK